MLVVVWQNYDASSMLQEQDEGDSSTVHYHFVQQALQPLVEMLLKLLSKQEEGQDEDDGIWNLSLAGGNCLSLVAAVVGDEVLALVMPYIQVCLSHLQCEALRNVSWYKSSMWQGFAATRGLAILLYRPAHLYRHMSCLPPRSKLRSVLLRSGLCCVVCKR